MTISLKTLSYIDGKWTEPSLGGYFEVINPANNSVISSVANCGSQDAVTAIRAASKAFQFWSKTPAEQRAEYLYRWYKLILQHQHELADLMTRECGKPLSESLSEVVYGASFLQWFSEEARRIKGDIIQSPNADKRFLVNKQAVGVCAAITPWNFPLAMIARKCAPALAAGCTIVVKPAEATPLTALAMADLAEQAGIPAGVFNVLPASEGQEIGEVFSTHPLVRKLSFTGSTAVGKILLKQAADTVKRISMELGGNAPFIVFDDADIDKAVEGAISSKYRNAGQTCICANRFLVQEDIYDKFIAAFSEKVKSIRVGDGLQPGIQQGPLINNKAVQKVDALVRDAIAKGADLICGGKVHELGGNFYTPTIIGNVDKSMAIAHEEIFGPVSPIFRFTDEREAIAMANDTPYGLAAYFYSQKMDRIWRVSEALEYGMIGINEGIISTTLAPFGGVKQSGIGREGGHYGIKEYLDIKYLCLGGLT
ncbi:MAG: NAD-dependent succinate-semialdehyde dehydrogenase [Pseudomonadales bacterium]|nr:NAD-dependent succinate-semialdehyde dehydrogenase [Pseudomonadales bacterium]